MEGALGLVEQRPVESRRVAHGKQVKGDIVMIMLKRRGRRQNNIGVAGRLIDVRVQGHHKVELLQRLVQLPTVGC